MRRRSHGPNEGVLVAPPPRITVNALSGEPLKILHKGFDGLDVAFQGKVSASDLETLEWARERAESEYQPTLVEIGPGKVPMHIAASGARGGYAFRGDTGPLGETWFFKRDLGGNGWDIRVSVKSMPLAFLGLERVRDDLLKKLVDMGVGAPQESIGRVDYAVDLLMPSAFTLEPDQFIAHSKATTSEHCYPLSGDLVGADEIQIHFAGRHASSVTVGKQPGRQVIVYDKRREVMQKQKLYWFDIWGIEPDDPDAIWRVEVRAGKKPLKRWGVTTFIDLENQIGDLLLNSLSAVRYIVSDGVGENVSRHPNHALWQAVQREMRDALARYQSGIVPQDIIEGERQRIHAQYVSQIIGLMPGALISNGYSEKEAEQKCAQFMMELAQKHKSRDPKRLRDKLARAKERLHFI